MSRLQGPPSSTMRRASPKSCARPRSSPVSIPTSPPRMSATSQRPTPSARSWASRSSTVSVGPCTSRFPTAGGAPPGLLVTKGASRSRWAAVRSISSRSTGKSLTATLMGILVKQGVYALEQPAPIPEWQGRNDPRAKIRIADLLHMSSGLRIRAPQDPDYDPSGPYPDHLYLYTGGVNSFHYAATRPLQWPPGTIGRYHNTDPVLVNYLVRLGVEKRGEEYLSFPRRALFDKIGIRSMVMETDPYGNFLTQGYELASARDWARLGNLYLQDGVWQGERILPDRFVQFVSTVAPAWAADHRPVYGGFFWINGDGSFPVPRSTYYMTGVGGQYALIIPSHDLVVVRLGHYKGEVAATESLKNALTLLTRAVPSRQ